MESDITPVTPTTQAKPGYKTTEFWLSLVAVLIGALAGSGIVPESGPWAQVIGLVTAVLGSLGYTVSRGIAKSGK